MKTRVVLLTHFGRTSSFMLYCDQLKDTLGNLEVPTVKDNKKIEYINLACGFDIETTSITVQGHKAAFMYVFMLGIGHGEPIFYGRTWEEAIECFNLLTEMFELSDKKRLVIYVHNLGYEFQFMRKYFKWSEVFAISERKPIKALTTGGIEFRDSYILSGYSLANTAKNLTKYKVEKMVGDLDYSLTRHSETPLTQQELGYCENDIKVVTAYIQEQIEYYQQINRIPATNTGRVRQYTKNECYYTSKSHKKSSKSKYMKYRKIMGDLTIEPELYPLMKQTFMGGYTHANANYSGVLLEDVSSIDFTSSYPSVMVSEKFPMSRFKPIEINGTQHLTELCSKFAIIAQVKFKNIRCKITQDNYISESKCSNLVKPVINNGRIQEAEELAISLTDVDYEIISQTYEWDNIAFGRCYFAHKNYLPKSIVKSVLDLYQSKTELKDVEGYETEYLLSKGMLNSIYGMCVTDIVKDNSIYEGGEWGVEPVSLTEEIEAYNSKKDRFLYYPWGVWVTAYARRNLWSGIVAVGDDYVYSDTDSLKMLNYSNHLEYIERFNKIIVQKMEKMCDYYLIDKKLLSPVTKKGVTKTLGVWDYEGTYSRFKTLGAKRYLVEEDGKLHLTVAGLSKQNGVNHMLEKCSGDHSKVFDLFNDDLYIPADKTGKMTHTYIDDDFKYEVVDYLGNVKLTAQKSSIHLESCDFTLSISKQYRDFLEKLKNGYLLTGEKEI